MNIDDLTLGQIKQIQGLCGGTSPIESEPFLGQYVVVRTYSAGVFAGTVKQRIGKKVLLENVRRLWRWKTANNGVSLSEVAVYGINQSNSKICCVESLKLIQDIEISPCSDVARKSIEEAKEYVYSS
jgi:hypothetical protein